MDDVFAEGALGTAAAARWLNERVADAHYSPMAIWRFMTRGCIATSGERIYLEHGKLGRKFFTSAAALSRFAARLAATTRVTGVTDSHSRSATAARIELETSGFFSGKRTS
jgi:hypothetical protein